MSASVYTSVSSSEMEVHQMPSPPGEFPGQPTVQEQLDAEFYANWLAESDAHPSHSNEEGEIAVDLDEEGDHYPELESQHDDARRVEAERPSHTYPYHSHQSPDPHPNFDDPPVPSLPPAHDVSTDPYAGYQHLSPPPPDDDHHEPPPPPERLNRPSSQTRRADTMDSPVRQPGRQAEIGERGRSQGGRGSRSGAYVGRDRRPIPREQREERWPWYDRPRRWMQRHDEYDDRGQERGYRSTGSAQVQVQAAYQPPPAPPAAAPAVNLGETMQVMMMSQMMQQQQQAQQMQAVQMAAMMGQKGQGGGGGGGCGRDSACGRKKGSTLVNIQGSGKKRRVVRKNVDSVPASAMRRVQLAPAVPALPPPPTLQVEEESGGFENWQEATIILCLIIVGLIYLVSSRATSEPARDDKRAARHLAGAQ